MACPVQTPLGALRPLRPQAHFFCVKRNGKRKHTRGYPWTPSAQPANAKDWAAPLTATIKMRLSALKKRFYFHGPQASCKAMERGTLFFVRPMPPKGGGGIPAGAYLLFAGSNG